MRAHFVNENVAGHATMHIGLRRNLRNHPEVEATFFDCPPRRGFLRLASLAIPGLARLDLDFQTSRERFARSVVVRRHLNRLRPVDALHIYTQNVALASVDLMRRQPTVVSTDTTNAQNFLMHPSRPPTRFSPVVAAAVQPLERRVYRAARMVVTHSAWAAESVIAYGVPEDRVRVIPFGVLIPESAPRRPTSSPQITYVGGSMARKGGWRVLETWRRHFKDQATLTLVTRDLVPPEPGLEVRNDLRPGTPAIWEVLARTAVLAFPTEVDTFGYAVLEAMAAGVPVVASRCAGISEIVEEGRTGLLFDVADDEGLRASLERCLSAPALARRMGDAGRVRAIERYDARVTTAQLVDVLREATSREPTGG